MKRIWRKFEIRIIVSSFHVLSLARETRECVKGRDLTIRSGLLMGASHPDPALGLVLHLSTLLPVDYAGPRRWMGVHCGIGELKFFILFLKNITVFFVEKDDALAFIGLVRAVKALPMFSIHYYCVLYFQCTSITRQKIWRSVDFLWEIVRACDYARSIWSILTLSWFASAFFYSQDVNLNQHAK